MFLLFVFFWFSLIFGNGLFGVGFCFCFFVVVFGRGWFGFIFVCLLFVFLFFFVLVMDCFISKDFL